MSEWCVWREIRGLCVCIRTLWREYHFQMCQRQKRLRTPLNRSLGDLKTTPPTSAPTHQYVLRLSCSIWELHGLLNAATMRRSNRISFLATRYTSSSPWKPPWASTQHRGLSVSHMLMNGRPHLPGATTPEQRGNGGRTCRLPTDPKVCVFVFHLTVVTVTLSRQIYITPQGREDTGRGVVMETDPYMAVRIV